MSKLGSYKRINKNDYDDDVKPTIDKLSRTVNDSFDALYAALNGKLSLSDNVQGTFVSFSVTVDGSGVPKTQTLVPLTSANRVVGVTVIKADNTSNSANLTGAPFITYRQSSQTIEILHVTGLVANNNYSLTIFAYN